MALVVTQRPQKDIYQNDPPATYEESYYTSRWVAGHLPIQYKISNTKWPLNSEDDTDNIASIYSTNGLATVQLAGTYETYEAKAYVKIANAPVAAYNGIWQIVTYLSPTLFVINTAFTTTSTGTCQKYYNNYNISVKLYAGIPPDHTLVAQDPMTLIATINVTPNTSNISIVDVAALVRQKLNTNNEIDQTGFPNDLNLWTSFYISYAESYDYVLAGVAATYTSTFTADTLENCTSTVALTNEEFTSNITGWSQDATSDLDWAYNSGSARVTVASSVYSSQFFYQAFSFLQGIEYTITFSTTLSVTNSLRFFVLLADSNPEGTGIVIHSGIQASSTATSFTFTPTVDVSKIYIRVIFNGSESNGSYLDLNYFRLTKSSDCQAYIFASNSNLPFKSTYGGNLGEYVQSINTIEHEALFLTSTEQIELFSGLYLDIAMIFPKATINLVSQGDFGLIVKEYNSSGTYLATSLIPISNNGEGLYRVRLDSFSRNSSTEYFTIQVGSSPSNLVVDGDRGRFDTSTDASGVPPSDWNLTASDNYSLTRDTTKIYAGTASLKFDRLVLYNNLVARWAFDTEVASITPDYFNVCNATVLGATQVTGKILNAYSFNGIDDGNSINVPHNTVLSLTNEFTIAFWMKTANLTQVNKYILGKPDVANTGNTYSVIYEFVNNQVEFFSSSYTGTNPRTGSGMTIADTNWHHVVYTYNGTTWAGYLDGVNIFSTARTFSLTTSVRDLRFGAYNGSVSGINNTCFAGLLDEIEIYNKGITSTDVTSLYNGGAGRQP